MTNPIKRVLGQMPFCPSLPPKGCPACLPGYYDAECLLPAALCPREETEFDRTIKIEIFTDLCGLHSFILPEASAQQKSRVFCLYYETRREKKDL